MKVLVLCGGPSGEREVSLRSGDAVADACQSLGYQVTKRDIFPEDLSALEGDFDIVFPVLHGDFGEDGQLQAILEERGLNFVGSDTKSSGIAFDKARTKALMSEFEIPTPPGLVTESAIEQLLSLIHI